MRLNTLTIKNHYLLALILALAAFLRIYGLNFQSIWDDEIASMIEANPELSFKESWEIYFNYDNMPPLYYQVLKILFSVFGYSAYVLRTFSALCGVAAVYALYLLTSELWNRRAGLIAALLLTLNQMQIQYSQEGRPYTFLTCFTILAFFSLIRLAAQPSLRSALWYSLFATLMLYGQYFALFLAVAQGLIGIALILEEKNAQTRKQIFKFSALALILIAICYVPALPQLFRNAGITSSWIEKPQPSVFSGIFSEFFGHSEMVLALVYISLILFFASIALNHDTADAVKMNRLCVLVFLWISVYLLIPLIRSYLVLPMIVPRYFTVLIPAVIIMMAIGINRLSNTLQALLVVLFVVFSLTDLFIVKSYYTTVTKPQYRESAAYINNSRKGGEPVVARVGWHYGYFIKDIKWMDLNNYFNQAGRGSLPASFWYAGVHENTLDISEPVKTLLDSTYDIDRRFDAHEVQAIHFVKKK